MNSGGIHVFNRITIKERLAGRVSFDPPCAGLLVVPRSSTLWSSAWYCRCSEPWHCASWASAWSLQTRSFGKHDPCTFHASLPALEYILGELEQSEMCRRIPCSEPKWQALGARMAPGQQEDQWRRHLHLKDGEQKFPTTSPEGDCVPWRKRSFDAVWPPHLLRFLEGFSLELQEVQESRRGTCLAVAFLRSCINAWMAGHAPRVFPH